MSDARVARLRRSLTALQPLDPRGDESRRVTLAALASLPRPLDATADPTHVTASAVVVGARGVLLHHHKRLRRWLQPGGHIDAAEEPEEAARRETVEETGLAATHPPDGARLLDVDVHALPAPCGPWTRRTGPDGGRPACTHLDVRYLLLADGEPAPPAGESPHVGWFDWPEALAVADAGLAAALRRAAERWPVR